VNARLAMALYRLRGITPRGVHFNADDASPCAVQRIAPSCTAFTRDAIDRRRAQRVTVRPGLLAVLRNRGLMP
jgi:hypothetical protein